jgi:tetratricopeptide (TPR) repeat protein
MRRTLVPAALAYALAAAPLPAAAAAPRSAEADSKTYERCLALARSDPAAAFELASTWRNEGGSPARHCQALALIGLKQPLEAAIRLEKLAQEMVKAPGPLRAGVLGQAGQAWLLGNLPEKAVAALNAALKFDPGNADLLIDRSSALASLGKYWEAVDDLNEVIERDRSRTDAFLYRASAYRYVDSLDLAMEDAQHALALDPKRPEGYLERGNIRRLKGDTAGARRDWLHVLALAPDSKAAADARDNIERLDVRVETFDPGPAKKKK